MQIDNDVGRIEQHDQVLCEVGHCVHVEVDIGQEKGASLGDGERRSPALADLALYIYTSGTTGLPKAANVSHHRLLQWSFWFAGLMNTAPDDRMYDCLPMYHSVGGIVATGALLVHGGSVAIREKFSAQNFWKDIADWDCTLFQYIGELCRYLVNGAEAPATHRLRMACGNGLRAATQAARRPSGAQIDGDRVTC